MGAVQNQIAAPIAEAQENLRLRYAITTALALMLTYLLPMPLGWPQPQTAATTVMLIAAKGMVSESLHAGAQ